MADESKSDDIRKKLNKIMHDKPAYPAAALVDRYLMPFLDAKFEEMFEYLAYLEDQIDGGADENIVDQASKLITLLVQLVDATFVSVGFLDTKGPTDKIPPDIKAGFQAAQAQMAAWTQALAEYEEEQDEEDEDEADMSGEPGGDTDLAPEADLAPAPAPALAPLPAETPAPPLP